ncbi:MAG: polyprenol phosphomannose-dependent alpha 1,6 mannosyltransferase MptB, partial [Mycobacteriaceae bacterium]
MSSGASLLSLAFLRHKSEVRVTQIKSATANYYSFLRGAHRLPALLGLIASCSICFGSFGSGAIRKQDPLLENLHLSWLRFGHGLALSSAILWIGVVLMIFSWICLIKKALDRSESVNELQGTVLLWLTPLLFSVPVFSRDAYSYLAQGALLRDGFDPYKVGPVENPGLLLDNVSTIWTTTTAPYGPAFILIAKFATILAGNNVVFGTIVLRLCMLPGILALLWSLPRIAKHFGNNPALAIWLVPLNPLVLIHLVGGVHNEMLMVGLLCLGIALVLEHRHPSGIAVVTVAVAIKATAALALPFLVWIWVAHHRENQTKGIQPQEYSVIIFTKICSAALAITIAIFSAFSLLA